MFIHELGDYISHYQEIKRYDNLIDQARNGKVTVLVAGTNQGEELSEACQQVIVDYLRAARNSHARELLKHGFLE